jgi:hypothetical protein
MERYQEGETDILRVIEFLSVQGTGLGWNRSLSDDSLATNLLSHGTALDEGEWSTEVSANLLREKEPLELLTGPWVESRVRLDLMEKRRS